MKVKEEDLLAIADEKTKGAVNKINEQLMKLQEQKKAMLSGLREKLGETKKVEKQTAELTKKLVAAKNAGADMTKILALFQAVMDAKE